MGRKAKRRYKGEVLEMKGRSGYYIRLRVEGKRIVRKGGETREDAEVFLAKVLQKLKDGVSIDRPRAQEIDFKEFVAEHLRFCKGEHSASTFKDESYRLNCVAEHFKGRNLASIERADIERLLLGLAERGLKPASRNRNLAQIRRLFERAIDLRYLEENPCHRMRQLREEERPVPVLSLEEQAVLLDACHPRIRDLVLTALDTGCREGELLRLEWADVDLDRGYLTVRASKNKKSRAVHLTARLRARLVQVKSGRTIPLSGPDRVFANLPVRWCGHSARLYTRAVSAIGHPGFRFHDLRHQTAINLTRAGVPLADVQKWLGHSSLRMTMRYSAHAPENSGEMALAKLEQRLGNAPALKTGTEQA